MVFIYILKLEEGKYYVGKTNNPHFRLNNHFHYNGSAWTKKYKPIQIIEIIPDCNDYDEDKYTRMYMDKYGINNVRGGSFVSLILDESTINHLTRMSNGTNNKCFKCGKKGHFVKNCKENKKCKYVWSCDYCNEKFNTKKLCEIHEEDCKYKVQEDIEDEENQDDEDEEEEFQNEEKKQYEEDEEENQDDEEEENQTDDEEENQDDEEED
jgi:hypothetical protein